MSEDKKKVLTMQGGKASWQKMTGGVDLDGLSGGQLFVREASEEIIASYDLGSYEPQVQGDGEVLIYAFQGYTGPALVEGTKYRVKIFEQTWDVVAEKVTLPNDGNPIEFAVIGNPWICDQEDFQDNGLPFCSTVIGSALALYVRAAEFASVTVGGDPADNSFVVWEVHDKELVSWPVLMLNTNDGTTLYDEEDNQITDFTEIRNWFMLGRTVMLNDIADSSTTYSTLVAVRQGTLLFGTRSIAQP